MLQPKKYTRQLRYGGICVGVLMIILGSILIMHIACHKPTTYTYPNYTVPDIVIIIGFVAATIGLAFGRKLKHIILIAVLMIAAGYCFAFLIAMLMLETGCGVRFYY